MHFKNFWFATTSPVHAVDINTSRDEKKEIFGCWYAGNTFKVHSNCRTVAFLAVEKYLCEIFKHAEC